MYSAIKVQRLNDKFQDPLYLFLELVRAGVMHGHLWSERAFSGGPSFGTGTARKTTLFGKDLIEVIFYSPRRRETMHVTCDASAEYCPPELQGKQTNNASYFMC